MRNATEKQIKYAEAISKRLQIELPKENDFDLYYKFIAEHEKNYKGNIELRNDEPAIRRKMLNPFKRENTEKQYKKVNPFLKNEIVNEYYNYVFNKKTLNKMLEMQKKKICGIYFLYIKNELVYIGKSINLGSRILTSCRQKSNKNNVITEFSFYKTKTQSDCHILEPYLITKYKPPLNTEFVADDSPTILKFDIDIANLKKYKAYTKKKEV